MHFSNKTLYDKKRLIRFSDFVMLQKRFFWAFMIVATLLVSICVAFSLAIKSNDSTIFICFGLIVFIDITYVFFSFVFPRIAVKKSPSLDAEVSYEFDDDCFKIDSISKNSKENAELKYSSLVKVMESQHDIYLFISARQAYVLDKSAFTVGTPAEFIIFLQSKNVRYKR